MALGDVTRGTISTVTDETNIKIDISEAIDFLDPFDTPLLDMVGRDSLGSAATQVKHEWLEDQLLPSEGTLGSAYISGSGSLVLATDEGKYLYPDDMILVDEIVFRILSGAPSSDTQIVKVESGTDAAIASGAIWRRISHAAQEQGEARVDGPKVALGKPFNYTQIIKDWIIISGTMEVISRYGYASERAYQEIQTLRRLAISLEMSLLYSVRTYSAGPPRKSSMGGLYHYVYQDGITNSRNNITDLQGAALTEPNLNDALQTMWSNGGMPDFMLVGGTNKRVMTSFALPRIRTEREVATAGASIGSYESDFGTIDILLNRWLRPSDIILGRRGSLGIGPLTGRQFSSRMLPSTGDYSRWEILGEYTMEVHKPGIDWFWLWNAKTSIG